MRIIQVATLTLIPLIGLGLLFAGAYSIAIGFFVGWMMFMGFITSLMFTENQ